MKEHLSRSQAAAGFYHEPRLWIGRNPVTIAGGTAALDATVFGETAFRQRLPCGIQIKATADGFFAFDFSYWPPGAFPPGPADPTRPFDDQPPDLTERVLQRTQVMNAFLACFYTSQRRMAKLAIDIMQVTPEFIVWMTDLDTVSGFGGGVPSAAYMAAASAPDVPAHEQLHRTYVHTDVVAKAAEDLSGLMAAHLMIRGAKAAQDCSYSAAVISYWAIAERLLNDRWAGYLGENRSRDGVIFINAQRLSALTGRDYTASIVTEILSLTGCIEAYSCAQQNGR